MSSRKVRLKYPRKACSPSLVLISIFSFLREAQWPIWVHVLFRRSRTPLLIKHRLFLPWAHIHVCVDRFHFFVSHKNRWFQSWLPQLIFSVLRQDPSCKKSKYLDFTAAQVKTLSFLAYVIKIYQVSLGLLHFTLLTTSFSQETIDQHSAALVKGMMNLMVTCPPSITNMRKEFFIATRHILSAQEIRPSTLLQFTMFRLYGITWE